MAFALTDVAEEKTPKVPIISEEIIKFIAISFAECPEGCRMFALVRSHATQTTISEKLKAMEERNKRIEKQRIAKQQLENEFTLGANKSSIKQSSPSNLDDIIPKASAQKSRVDEFMNFLGNIEQEFS